MKRMPFRPPPSLRRGVSTALGPSFSERLHQELTSRQIPLFYDYLQPQQSHLLNLTLSGLLPRTWFALPESSTILPSLPSVACPPRLAEGHHLVYFPPQVTLSQLLPDGTDVLHSPGEPFNRRLWAGGRVRFTDTGGPLLLDGSRAVCIETIRNVTTKGQEGAEKIFVAIERRIGRVQEGEEESSVKGRIWQENEEDTGQASVIENRDLVFMRKKTQEQVDYDKERFKAQDRIVKPPQNPVFRHEIKPTKALLFRFSALTFNAHSIHLDKTYTQNVEGYRNLLVHGPLSLVLLLTVFRAQITIPNLFIREIEYRNILPLYAEEKFAICGKPKTNTNAGAWDVWIENKDGGLVVRATVRSDTEPQSIAR